MASSPSVAGSGTASTVVTAAFNTPPVRPWAIGPAMGDRWIAISGHLLPRRTEGDGPSPAGADSRWVLSQEYLSRARCPAPQQAVCLSL